MADFAVLVPKLLTTRHNSISLETLTAFTNTTSASSSSTAATVGGGSTSGGYLGKDLPNTPASELLKELSVQKETSLYCVFAHYFLAEYENKLMPKLFESLAQAIHPAVRQLART